jgi:diguanylate cyclase (GGDEF)-like protein
MYGSLSEIIEMQTDQSAARIRTLWQIATSAGLSEHDHIQMILDVTIANIRPLKNVFATLSHVNDDDVVIDAVSIRGDSESLVASVRTYQGGVTFPAEADLQSTLRTLDRTCVWDSPATLPRNAVASALGWKSAIGTVFHIGTRDYFVLFGLTEPLENEPFTDADRAFIEVVAANLSQLLLQHNQFERLRFQIEHDPLTGVYNRTQFSRFVRNGLVERNVVGIALIDLDEFRIVNELSGNMIADEVLVEIGARLNGVSEADRICRIDGDEFAVVFGRLNDEESLELRLLAYKTAFERPFHTGDRDGLRFMPISASIGAAKVADGFTIDDLLRRSHVALEESQRLGRGELTLFGDDLEGTLRARSLHRGVFLAAIEANEFLVEYQPTYELNMRTITGAEALIRWNHPARGRLPPGEFLAEAERAEALYPLTIWIVGRILRDLSAMELPPGFRCYFNVPASVLERSTFLSELSELLDSAPGLASNLGLELTESEVMHRVDVAIDNLNSVRDLGLTVSIDDFGTGNSSLGYLKRLPIDIVKLDKLFINGLPHDAADVGLAQMFLGLTRQFSLVSVAEGIENEDQAQWLLDHGCMIGQGFLFSKSVPIEELKALMQSAHA